MPTITFSEFANAHAPFAEVVAYATTDVVARLAKKKGRLASKGIDAEYDEPRPGSTQSASGSITAGCRRVARFYVTD